MTEVHQIITLDDGSLDAVAGGLLNDLNLLLDNTISGNTFSANTTQNMTVGGSQSVSGGNNNLLISQAVANVDVVGSVIDTTVPLA